jgi:hypothetical protein
MGGARTAAEENNQVLEAKLIVGRFIHFTRPSWPGGAPPAAQIPALFATQPQQLLNIAESTGIFTKTSGVTAGAHPNVNKPWRTFSFLSWLPGSISEVQTGTSDVLTGPMSGCDLVLYNRGGARYAGHLGTDVSVTPGDAKDLANLSIKGVWNNFAQNAPAADIIGGFNPFRQWNGAFPVATGDDLAPPIFYGLYTTANTFYAMALFIQKSAPGSASAHPTLKRIAGLQLINTKTLAQLRNL